MLRIGQPIAAGKGETHVIVRKCGVPPQDYEGSFASLLDGVGRTVHLELIPESYVDPGIEIKWPEVPKIYAWERFLANELFVERPKHMLWSTLLA